MRSFGKVVVDSDSVRSEVPSVVFAVVEAVDGRVISGGHGRPLDVVLLIDGRMVRMDERDELSELGDVSVDMTEKVCQISEVDSNPDVDVDDDDNCDDVSKLDDVEDGREDVTEDVLCWSFSVE